MCVFSQLRPFTESYGRKFICWQLIVRIPGRSLQYLHKVFHCVLSEREGTKTPEIHRASCIKLILSLSFRYLRGIFASPLSIPEHSNAHKRAEDCLFCATFLLVYNRRLGEKKGWIYCSWCGNLVLSILPDCRWNHTHNISIKERTCKEFLLWSFLQSFPGAWPSAITVLPCFTEI